MIEAVFISDLHLCLEQPEITDKFNQFMDWAETHVQTLYILGDFFNLWAGDDTGDAFSNTICQRIARLNDSGITIYFMHGNRDFLLAKGFFKQSKVHALDDPSVITLGELKILLSHGDRYCIHDSQHQRFRRLTRNFYFKKLFLMLPRALRMAMAQKIRQKSQARRHLTMQEMDVNPQTLLDEMQAFDVTYLIHGHTHKPLLHTYLIDSKIYSHYVLSDWDDTPLMLCYSRSKGLYYMQFKPDVGDY